MKTTQKFQLVHRPRSLHTSNGASCGFTLIEIMVSISIFALIMVIAIGAVLSIVAANRKTQALNSVMTNLNFALESMSRDLRTGFDYDCIPGTVELDDCNDGNSEVSLTSIQYGEHTRYFWSPTDKKIYKILGDGSQMALTADDVNIDTLTFYVKNSAPATSPTPDYAQPKIIISIKGSFKGYGAVTDFRIQTTVSQRKLDI